MSASHDSSNVNSNVDNNSNTNIENGNNHTEPNISAPLKLSVELEITAKDKAFDNYSNSNDFQNSHSLSVKTEDLLFNVKRILFGGTVLPIIMQKEDGACPLIALCNVLLLSKKIVMQSNIDIISGDDLIKELSNVLLNTSSADQSEIDHNYIANLDSALGNFHHLLTGLYINVKFQHISDFEFTDILSIFDLCHVNLVHGWLVDPQMPEIASAVSNLSYNEIVEKTLPMSDTDQEVKFLLNSFIEMSTSQLTFHGISELSRCLSTGSLSVFFRNNHFNTLFKHATGQCFILVTDMGYLDKPKIIWETLNSVNGDVQLVDANFKVFNHYDDDRRENNQFMLENDDFNFALKIQNEEHERVASGGHAILPSSNSTPKTSLSRDNNYNIDVVSSSAENTHSVGLPFVNPDVSSNSGSGTSSSVNKSKSFCTIS